MTRQEATEFYRSHSKAVYNTALRIVRDPEEAEEIMQDTFMKYFTKGVPGLSEARKAAWLRTTCIRMGIDFLRRRKKGLELFVERIPDEAAPASLFPYSRPDTDRRDGLRRDSTTDRTEGSNAAVMVFPGKGKTYQGIENGKYMNKLDDFIRDNAAAFDTELPPEGAEDRFLRKWEAGRLKVRIFRTVLPAAAAAVLAAVLLLPPAGRSTDWLRGAGDSPEGIYLAYMEQVSAAWEKAGPDDILSAQLSSVTEEAIPLLDLLPDELGDAEKSAILREHYNTLLDGVHNLLTNAK